MCRYAECYYDVRHNTKCPMLSVAMLCVIILSVVAPTLQLITIICALRTKSVMTFGPGCIRKLIHDVKMKIVDGIKV